MFRLPLFQLHLCGKSTTKIHPAPEFGGWGCLPFKPQHSLWCLWHLLKVELDTGDLGCEAAYSSPFLPVTTCTCILWKLPDCGSHAWASQVLRVVSCLWLPSPTHRHKWWLGSSHPVSGLISSMPLLSWARQDLAQLLSSPKDSSVQTNGRLMHMHTPCTQSQLYIHTFTHPLFIVSPLFFYPRSMSPCEHLTHFLTNFCISFWVQGRNTSSSSWFLGVPWSGR